MRLPCHEVILWILVLFCKNGFSIPIDNGILDEPGVICGSDSVILEFKTKNPFKGNIYARGFFDDARCRQPATGIDSDSNTFTLNLNERCGITRRRQTNPRAMIVEATIVVMFHRMFITKVDKAFKVRCLYQEGGKTLDVDLNVSMITTEEITDSIAMPTCTYEVLSEGPDGAPVTFARIGQQVYHKWTCEGGTEDALCMTVHSCTVDDGQGKSRDLLDSNGCAQDRYLLQNLDYLTTLMAGREAHVFKFADKPTVHFNCQVRIHVKQDDTCVRTSDNCPDEPGSPLDGGIPDDFETLPPTPDVFIGSPRTTKQEDAFPTPLPFPLPPARRRGRTRGRSKSRSRNKRSVIQDEDDELGSVDVASNAFTVIGIQETVDDIGANLSNLRQFGSVTLVTPPNFLCVSHSTAGLTISLIAILLLSTSVSGFCIFRLKMKNARNSFKSGLHF